MAGPNGMRLLGVLRAHPLYGRGSALGLPRCEHERAGVGDCEQGQP